MFVTSVWSLVGKTAMTEEWSHAHKVEAQAATFRLCEKAALEGNRKAMEWLLCCSRRSEKAWRTDLKFAGFDDATINREVKRVNKLVSGEWVRETVWLVDGRICHGGEMKAKMCADQSGDVVTKRTRVGRPRKE